MERERLGIDLGGTKIEAVVLAADGRVRFRERVPTPRGSYQAIVTALADLVKRVDEEFTRLPRVGVGIPGVVSAATGLVKNANSTELIGHPLHHDLEHCLGRPVRVANDANCFALSETLDGAVGRAAAAGVVFGAILGTGAGGGVVIGGTLIPGADGIAGEWGHNPLPWLEADETPGLRCWCGQYGCVETFVSGGGLVRAYRQLGGQAASAAQIAALACEGESLASAAIARYESWLARGLASVINVLNPDVIVLGGGVSNIDSLYERVPRLWVNYVFSDKVTTQLLKAKHGDSSGVRGAAWLWPAADVV